MGDVSIRDLRNRGGDIVDDAAAGEEIRITRGGKPVATLCALPAEPLSRSTLIEQWRALEPIDAARLRSDIDEVLDSRL